MTQRPLQMTLQARADGVLVGLGCANGQRIRYEVRGVKGDWTAEVAFPTRYSWATHTLRHFTSVRAAVAFVRRDFERRQMVKLVPANDEVAA